MNYDPITKKYDEDYDIKLEKHYSSLAKPIYLKPLFSFLQIRVVEEQKVNVMNNRVFVGEPRSISFRWTHFMMNLIPNRMQ